MSVIDWSPQPSGNAVADRSIPAHDGASGREIPSLIRGVMAAIRRMSDAQGGALTTAGVGDAYTVTTGVGLTSLRAGLQFMVRANRDSVIAPTLRIDGLPAVDWLSAGADVPVVLRAGRIYSVVYDAASDVVRSIIPEMSVDASAPLRTLDYFGALGSGRDEDAAFAQAIEYMASSGRKVGLKGGGLYGCNTKIVIPAGGGLVGAGGSKILARRGSFNNQDLTPDGRKGNNAVVIDLSGHPTDPAKASLAPSLENVRVVYGAPSGSGTDLIRAVSAVRAFNVLDALIADNEIVGFPLGKGIVAGTLQGNGRIIRNHIHDFLDNSTGWLAANVPQITGIEIDNDRVGGIFSDGVLIEGNRIVGLKVGADFLAAYGYQTDGINLCGTLYARVIGNYIRFVGEGIDSFGSHGTFSGNELLDCYIFGLKFIHGAKNNAAFGNVIMRFGLAGITLAGSTEKDVGNTTGNRVSGNLVKDYAANPSFSTATSACVLMQDNGGANGSGNTGGATQLPTGNVIENNTLDPNGASYGIVRSNAGSNDYADNKLVQPGRSGEVAHMTDGGKFVPYVKTNVRVSAAAAVPLTAGGVALGLDTVSTDRRSEFSTATQRLTIKSPGDYDVALRSVVSGLNSGDRVLLDIRVNGNTVATVFAYCPNGAFLTPVQVGERLTLKAGDYVEFQGRITGTGSVATVAAAGGIPSTVMTARFVE